MSVEQMREYVSNAYKGAKWQIKVKYMPVKQVMAIYFRMMEERNRN